MINQEVCQRCKKEVNIDESLLNNGFCDECNDFINKITDDTIKIMTAEPLKTVLATFVKGQIIKQERENKDDSQKELKP